MPQRIMRRSHVKKRQFITQYEKAVCERERLFDVRIGAAFFLQRQITCGAFQFKCSTCFALISSQKLNCNGLIDSWNSIFPFHASYAFKFVCNSEYPTSRLRNSLLLNKSRSEPFPCSGNWRDRCF